MALAPNKTKLVCTIGPASQSFDVLPQMLQAGMNVARVNLSQLSQWNNTLKLLTKV